MELMDLLHVVGLALLWISCALGGTIFARWWYDHRQPKCVELGCQHRVSVQGIKCYEHAYRAPLTTNWYDEWLSVEKVRQESVPTFDTVEQFVALSDRFMQWAPHLPGCSTEESDPCDCGWVGLSDDFGALKKTFDGIKRSRVELIDDEAEDDK